MSKIRLHLKTYLRLAEMALEVVTEWKKTRDDDGEPSIEGKYGDSVIAITSTGDIYTNSGNGWDAWTKFVFESPPSMKLEATIQRTRNKALVIYTNVYSPN